MIGQSIPHLRFPSSKKWDCEFKERWEINQLKSWRGEENRENIEVGIYRMGNLSRGHCIATLRLNAGIMAYSFRNRVYIFLLLN
jgi:hypothetical protein